MAVHKVQLRGKRVSWRYEFSVGSRAAKIQHRAGGFATKGDAEKAEAAARLQVSREKAIAASGSLATAIGKFFDDAAERLSPKTLERYRELAAYLHPDLLAMPMTEVRALHLHDEWARLLREGGKSRAGLVRALSRKTVRNIASVVSSACSWAVLYGLITVNPATASKPPSGKGKRGIALAPSQVHLLTDAATGWLAEFLEVQGGLGLRRGEALALRWSDIRDGMAHVSRSLGQAGKETYFKSTKTGNEKRVGIPASTMAAIERQRAHQATQRAAEPNYDIAVDLVFADPFGRPLKPDSVSAKVSLHFRRLKLAGSLHTLRHTHGSQLIADGADPGAVAARLGHGDAGTTLRIYTHAVPERGDLAEQWERLQEKKPQ